MKTRITPPFAGNCERIVLILGIAGFISAADNWIVSPILPAIASDLSVSFVRAGMLLTAYMIPYGAMQPVYGFLADRWGKPAILRWTVFGLAAGTLGCAASGSFPILCVWRSITGFFAAGIIAVSLAIIGDIVPLPERQTYVGKFMGTVFLGQGLSVGLGGFFAEFLNWRIAFFSFAFLAFLSSLLLRKLPHSRPTDASPKFMPEIVRVVRTPAGRVIFPLAAATGFLLLGLYGYLGSALHDVSGLSFLQVGLVMMFYGFACLVSGAYVGRIGQRIGERNTILAGGALAFLSALLLLLSSAWQTGLFVTVGLGSGYILIQSTLATLAFDVASENKGLPSALIGLGLFGGGGLGTACGGVFLSLGGYRALWLFYGIGTLLFLFTTHMTRLGK